MKKLILFFSVFAIGAIFLTSCELNDIPKFDDKDSFVAFGAASKSISEQGGVLSIPVTLASINGTTTTATYEIVNGTAILGTNFTLVDATGTISFDSNKRTNNIQINIINKAGVYTGDLSFTVKLKASPDAKIGSENSCVVTITDQDHPLAAILGNYTASGDSYFDGPSGWTVTFTKDSKDVSLIWITNLLAGGEGSGVGVPVYGVVNNAKTEIKIPVGQTYATHSSYTVLLSGYYGPDGMTAIETGGNITIKINPNYSMVIQDEMGTDVFSSTSVLLGNYNYFKAGTTLVR